MDNRYRRVKHGCYIFGVTMAVLINLSPMLFLTLRERYGISFGALGGLIAVNFITQLLVDLLFSYFSYPPPGPEYRSPWWDWSGWCVRSDRRYRNKAERWAHRC